MVKGKERTSISGHHATSNVHERATVRKVPNSKREKYYHERKRQKEKKKEEKKEATAEEEELYASLQQPTVLSRPQHAEKRT